MRINFEENADLGKPATTNGDHGDRPKEMNLVSKYIENQ